MKNEIILYTRDGGEKILPHAWEICSHCDGEGKSSAYLGAFTRHDLDEMGDDFVEDYMAGHFDRACESCGGAGKVRVVDRRRTRKEDLAAYDEQEAEAAAERRSERMERLFEGGWRDEDWR